ncbi:hypothetical protein ASG43_06390 [Aureimonas sp. Leaf454]|uniref:hypothetical protein n=1 Tax=Aureimonas sp. Leaf454 TaxID=1736381 RepID=UPI0006F24285|nr:hypothetical protein [Aureimonas sp. Leaf454]KQT50881.1 hypothetical protein ASG43_06390 [Aureimonas sp. Leaf454]
MKRRRNLFLYVCVLAVQTAAASFLFWVIFPLFRRMILWLGEPQEISPVVDAEILLGALLLNCAYFARYRWIEVRSPFRSALVGHLVQFASRISFFFGGTLFSALFFRHLPELDRLPSLEEALPRVALILWVLFALFCYSLELDRLGKAIEEGCVTVD